jgi:hypothetical protein
MQLAVSTALATARTSGSTGAAAALARASSISSSGAFSASAAQALRRTPIRRLQHDHAATNTRRAAAASAVASSSSSAAAAAAAATAVAPVDSSVHAAVNSSASAAAAPTQPPPLDFSSEAAAAAAAATPQHSDNHADHLAAAAAEPAPDRALDLRIQRVLFASKARLRARGVLDRMQRMRSKVALTMHGGQSNNEAAESAAAAAAAAAASSSSIAAASAAVPAAAASSAPSHPPLSASSFGHSPSSVSVLGADKELSMDEAVKRVFHGSLVSRLGARLGRTKSRVVLQRWRKILAHLLQMGGSSTGNSVRLFSDGTAAYAAMWSAIRGARTSIHMESYIVEPDGVGQKTMRLLAEAARRGVRVHFCYDSWGSENLMAAPKYVDELKEAGAQVVHFNPSQSLARRIITASSQLSPNVCQYSFAHPCSLCLFLVLAFSLAFVPS